MLMKNLDGFHACSGNCNNAETKTRRTQRCLCNYSSQHHLWAGLKKKCLVFISKLVGSMYAKVRCCRGQGMGDHSPVQISIYNNATIIWHVVLTANTVNIEEFCGARTFSTPFQIPVILQGLCKTTPEADVNHICLIYSIPSRNLFT